MKNKTKPSTTRSRRRYVNLDYIAGLIFNAPASWSKVGSAFRKRIGYGVNIADLPEAQQREIVTGVLRDLLKLAEGK
jgi:hypothetical protein